MADKAKHLGKWWCACGHSEPRPRLTPEEAATLDWLEANGVGHPDCGCPEAESLPPHHPHRIYGGIARRPERPHTPECLARRERLDGAREAARRAAEGLRLRLGSDAKQGCPDCGGVMVPMRAGEGFPN